MGDATFYRVFFDNEGDLDSEDTLATSSEQAAERVRNKHKFEGECWVVDTDDIDKFVVEHDVRLRLL